jgi:Putative transposase
MKPLTTPIDPWRAARATQAHRVHALCTEDRSAFTLSGGGAVLRHLPWPVPAGQRDRLERVCQYVLRPPMGSERVALTQDEHVRLQLRQPWTDGTTHLVFDPIAFLGRLAVLVPRPRVSLVLYHGVIAPQSSWRALIVPRGADRRAGGGGTASPHAGYRWAELMRRNV